MLRKLMLFGLAAFVFAVPAMAQDATAEAMTMEYTVNLSGNDTLGDFFVGPNGMTLYTFDRDTLGVSNCSGRCLENWPALTVESADALTADAAIPGVWGTITREDDGTTQVTYNGWPLYYWAHDAAVGDTTGQAVGKVWWVASPATLQVGVSEELGRYLTASNGMTVYLFTKDEPGVSNCSGDCLANWPAYTVESADDLLAGAHVGGEIGTIEREDGALQVTYNGWPLYFWAKDAAVGDTTGNAVGDVWWVVQPETVVTSSTDELESFLTDANGFTLYTFSNDTEGVSNCADACAEAWPPFTAASAESVVLPEGVTGEVAVIERADGGMQVTYNGMPLYYYAEDVAAGDVNGQGVGEVWWVAVP